ncbi:hypothetical protein CR194_05175 [Salipaludibacillus keqinensis]|uniref:Uncharacterized protein n=1 Tax=Salipaludibacillus keqinensis TaxID=2045207 RepID=A0A323TLF6_9BACI|nr:hypothetical protein [Salipaludibacillus keqinensis]PYZ94916.1 hypothetical protein CR194_05175 [Salipaludibacillus keqinensis]
MRDEFKVIKILEQDSIVINGGLNNGLTFGQEVEIFVPGDEIIDIDSEEVLGTLDFIKERLELTEVYEKFSVCEKYEEREVHIPSPLSRVLAEATPPFAKGGRTEIVRERVPLRVNDSQKTSRVKANRTIELGDRVRSVIVE